MLRDMTPVTPAPAPAKVRPSWWWFVLGGGLLVAAVASGIGLFIWTLTSFLSTDGSVPVDGQAHVVEIDHEDDLMLWADELGTAPSCQVRDAAGGTELALRSPSGTFTRSGGSGSWRAFAVVDGGAERVEVTCAGDPTASMTSTAVEIGPAPSLGSFGLGLLLTIGVPLLLGGTGIVIVIVTGVLWSTRAATRR